MEEKIALFIGQHPLGVFLIGFLLFPLLAGQVKPKDILATVKGVFGHGEVVNNITVKGEGAMAEEPRNMAICDPEKCVAYAQQKLRSERNRNDIDGLKTEVHGLTELFFQKLNFIQQQNNVMLRAMVKNNQLKESDIPKEII